MALKIKTRWRGTVTQIIIRLQGIGNVHRFPGV